MTVTVWTRRAPRKAHSDYPAYTDDHISNAVLSMMKHYLADFAQGMYCEVRITNDGKSKAESRAQLDAESDAADRSEAMLREMGG